MVMWHKKRNGLMTSRTQSWTSQQNLSNCIELGGFIFVQNIGWSCIDHRLIESKMINIRQTMHFRMSPNYISIEQSCVDTLTISKYIINYSASDDISSLFMWFVNNEILIVLTHHYCISVINLMSSDLCIFNV